MKLTMTSWLGNLPEDAVYDTIESPIGRLLVIVSRKGVHALISASDEEASTLMEMLPHDSGQPILVQVRAQLAEYFGGRRRRFDLPLVLEGTEFQKQVWSELAKIPYGETISYGEQARRIGKPNAMRAVGGANGRNPISIIIPCHRVIGADGGLTGFGWGTHNKKTLLDLERRYG
jgi:methylated-DNA-[protein]-cysteine S-methyltransferase